MSLHQITKDHFDQYAATWHSKLKQHAFRERHRKVQKILKKLNPRAVLDIGCGTGDYAPLFNLRQVNYLGLDLSEKMIETAQKLYPAYAFSVGNGEALMQPENAYDLILSIAVLEYLEDPHAHLKECARVTQKGGNSIIAVPNEDNIALKREEFLIQKLKLLKSLKFLSNKKNEDKERGFIKDKRVQHKKYSIQTMKELGKIHGLELIDAKYAFLRLLPTFTENLLPLNEWIEKTFSYFWEKPLHNIARKNSNILICHFRKL